MSYLETLTRFLMRLVQHPVTKSILRHAIHAGVAELVRQVTRKTKASRNGDLHFS